MTGSRGGPAPDNPTTGSRSPGERRIALLTGGRGTGKTTACRHLLERARDLELACAGIISPARFDGGAKVGIDVLDVRTGERRALAAVEGADAADGLPGRIRLGPHRFDEAAIAWARGLLEAACPCDVLVVDEIGPLEIELGEGWANALGVLRDGDYRLAVVVVRSRLLEAARVVLADLPGTVVVERSALTDADPVGDLVATLAATGPRERCRPGEAKARPPG